MGKGGVNQKSAEAKARKMSAKETAKMKKEIETEEAKWKDNDPALMKKLARKQEREAKASKEQQKKAELKALQEEDEKSLAPKPKQLPVGKAPKMTRAQIEAQKLKAERERKKAEKLKRQQEQKLVQQGELTENLNRVTMEESASTVDSAIAVLSGATSVEGLDIHPEKRVKAAYLAFEQKMLPQLKSENPGLRLSQLKQMVRKSFDRSSENPLNS